MANENLNSNPQVETVQKIYAALNLNDLSTYLSFFDANIERYETFGSRGYGLEGLKANFSQGRDTWAEGACIPEKFIPAGDKVVVFVHVKVRLKEKKEWIDGRVTDVFTFQDSKVVQFYSFGDRAEALKWAGANKD